MLLANGIAPHVDAMGVVNQPIEDAVGGRGIADLFVPVSDRQLRGQDRRARLMTVLADLPEVAAFGFRQRSHGPDHWKDPKEALIVIRHNIVVNTVPLHEIVAHQEHVAADPHQSELMELMIHKQYFHPAYVNYEPDYRQRVERAIEWVIQKGDQPTLCYFPGSKTPFVECTLREK